MKALTLTQPYATLIAIGAKHIETRSWATNYRGPLAIHAAKGFPAGCRELVNDPYDIDLCKPFVAALRPHGYTSPTQLPRGAIIAVCEIVACMPVNKEAVALRLRLNQNERTFGDYSPGRYAWLLADIRALPEPIPAKGALGLWEWDGEL